MASFHHPFPPSPSSSQPPATPPPADSQQATAMLLPSPPPKNPINHHHHHCHHQLFLPLLLLLLFPPFSQAATTCKKGCDLALGSYYVAEIKNIDLNLTYISSLFSTGINNILQYNPNITSKDQLPVGIRIHVPLSTCDCINNTFLGHTFNYTVQVGDTYDLIANYRYANLTSAEWLDKVNVYPANNIPDGGTISVVINCSCGDSRVSKKYGLFATYPLRPGDNLTSVAEEVGVSGTLLQAYNPGVNFANGSGLVFVPAKDQNGTFPALHISKGISGAGIAGIIVAAVVVALVLVYALYFCLYRRRKTQKASLLRDEAEAHLAQQRQGSRSTFSKASAADSAGLIIDGSVEFPYEELADATDNFNLSNKIGQGGFGAVYYAELRGQRAAIKKMARTKASKEFLAELKILTNVNHMNLVRLIGFCADRSLFLVYEFMENGNLTQHLRESRRDPLPWSTRVQIALDSARGLEYIHEHTVPVYIHRDIKSANILIDQNFHAKVADFGLARLTEGESGSVYTENAVGTRGYMPPEYLGFGSVSPKTDVYAFGVVLFELISAKEAIVVTTKPDIEYRKLVDLFDDALCKPQPDVHLRELVDQRLGDHCPLESVHKMALLAKACTQEDPKLRPIMRSVVVALAMLTSGTEKWDIGMFVDQQALRNLMSGR